MVFNTDGKVNKFLGKNKMFLNVFFCVIHLNLFDLLRLSALEMSSLCFQPVWMCIMT